MSGLKELVVVFTIAALVFMAARRLCTRYLSPETYDRRCLAWLGLTVVAFLVPSFWLYVLVALPVMAWLAKRDENPHALLLLFYYLIPPLAVEIPTIGINRLFDVTQLRLLGFALLIPLALRGAGARPRLSRWQTADTVMASFLILQLVLLMPYESLTNTMRRMVLLFLDIFIVFYVMSRVPPKRENVVDAMLMLCLVCATYAPMAVFESAKSWLMYAHLGGPWGVPNNDGWLFRDDLLRAQVAAGHALSLGYVLAMGFCFWLYFAHRERSRILVWGVAALIWLGLIATNSRGPWLSAVLALFVTAFLSADSAATAAKRAGVMVVAILVTLVSPIGETIIAKLPFVGSEAEAGTVAYRQRLLDIAYQLIWENPFFGSPFVTLQMEELRQGQGIIDLVNGYVNVALFYGLVGLFLYLALFIIAVNSCYRGMKLTVSVDRDLHVLGAVLLAGMVATMFFTATAGFAAFQYVIAGLLLSYARVATLSCSASSSIMQRSAGRNIENPSWKTTVR